MKREPGAAENRNGQGGAMARDFSGEPTGVLSFVSVFGERSESWLYRQLVASARYRYVVCAQAYVNRAEYPHEQVLAPTVRLEQWRNRLRRWCGRPARNWVVARRRAFGGMLAGAGIKLVQAHFGWTGYEAWELVRDDPRPYVVWLYGSDVFRRGRGREDTLPFLAKTRAWFACTSRALRAEAIALGCRPERVAVIYPGIAIPEYRGKSRGDEKSLRIISAGRLVDFKNPLGLVEVARRLKEQGVEFGWKHFGDGTLREAMREAIGAAGLGEVFELRGEVANAELLSAMRGADAMVHQAQIAKDGGRESFGVVLVEAAAAGLPVVSCRVGGIPEIIMDQRTGFLVEPGAQAEMAQRVALLARNRELLAAMGEAAHEHARRTFEEKKQRRALESYYDEVLRTGAPASGGRK